MPDQFDGLLRFMLPDSVSWKMAAMCAMSQSCGERRKALTPASCKSFSSLSRSWHVCDIVWTPLSTRNDWRSSVLIDRPSGSSPQTK
jgi:hypothetical protein